MNHFAGPAYGLWMLVVVNSLVFILFAFSFARPRSARDWRSFGAFSAFLVALFGFVAILFGFLLQWPTILTLAMFPVLVWMYVRLSIAEEREAERQFGDEWSRYAARTPRFLPRSRAGSGRLGGP